MSIHICESNSVKVCVEWIHKPRDGPEKSSPWTFYDMGDGKPTSRWNKKSYPLNGFKIKDLRLVEFCCGEKQKHKFNLDSDENIQVGDYIYIKDLGTQTYYIKISESLLRNLRVILIQPSFITSLI
jgi:hypothetical protein